MPLSRMPSKALIDALGWDAIQELEAFVDDAAGAGVGSVQPELKPPVGAFHDLPRKAGGNASFTTRRAAPSGRFSRTTPHAACLDRGEPRRGWL